MTPHGIAVDVSNQHVAVTCYSNMRVQIFDYNGKFLRKFNTASMWPYCVAADHAGNWLVSDSSKTVTVFSPEGKRITELCSSGDFSVLCGVCVDHDGRILFGGSSGVRVFGFEV